MVQLLLHLFDNVADNGEGGFVVLSLMKALLQEAGSNAFLVEVKGSLVKNIRRYTFDWRNLIDDDQK
ncbi:MAG: hypothetical protein BAA00_16110 [Parageobacillus thermoglucosidasius]|uniref:Uncharacterized protein n=2 Tax=Anoxybacillaceae TaxID=3120669 RepID=A0A1B7KR84_PARTM|nr:hypothetical protein Geoth_1976 [Parageobacillus thermoglucosidasius C56-YS93]MBY6270131.1 hypothetical protein [Parageobacillus thermoglucosidasius]QPA31434.1 hypothetical protein ISX45_18750 [Anoxybacillus caldiproteolyticus]OAT72587.1 hypothetical protein A7K69_19535 [Parageobacillus thermoglucosidasius]OUM85118.1 MAG: hypothetical protein BAA00_16110 [Parageobacillus thermoglucosidasius]